MTNDDALTNADDDLTSASDIDAEAQLNDAGNKSDLQKERDSYLLALQHLQADFENYRKRVAKQQTESFVRANEELVIKLLPVLDTIDLALMHNPSSDVEQVRVALMDVLSKEGLERVASVSEEFDPNHHEAVMHEPGDGAQQLVSEEMRAGYRLKGKVIRPAMVKVTG